MNKIFVTNSMTCTIVLLLKSNFMTLNSASEIGKYQNTLVLLTLMISGTILFNQEEKSSLKILKMKFTYISLCFMLLMLFSCKSYMIFFIIFESSMIPIFIIVTVWGNNPERVQAAFYMMIYTMLASLPMLGSIISSLNYNKTSQMKVTEIFKSNNNLVWFCVFLVFLVKMPTMMMHLWLPKAHVEAPASGSMLLAGILLKMGGYGFIKFIPLVFYKLTSWNTKLMSLGLFGGLTISMMCTRQTDLKVMIALSSVAHMSLVLAAIVTCSKLGVKSAILIMLAHGLCSACLFFTMNTMYNKTNSRNTQVTKGIMTMSPSTTLGWFLACVLNMSAPPSINFSGEILMAMSILSFELNMFVTLLVINLLVGIYCILMFSLTTLGSNLLTTKPNNELMMTSMNQNYMNMPLVLSFLLVSSI